MWVITGVVSHVKKTAVQTQESGDHGMLDHVTSLVDWDHVSSQEIVREIKMKETAHHLVVVIES